jgi:hypothetical protein
MARHLLLIPCTLIHEFLPLQPFEHIAEYFRSHTDGFVTVLCRRVRKKPEQVPRPLLAAHIPKDWQRIPPRLYNELRQVKCLVFPGPKVEPESGLLHAELAKCGAEVVDEIDADGQARAVFVHRAWVWQLSGLLGLTERRKRPYKRFYAYGSGGLWNVAEWDVREIWLIGESNGRTQIESLNGIFVCGIGGMVTFTRGLCKKSSARCRIT